MSAAWRCLLGWVLQPRPPGLGSQAVFISMSPGLTEILCPALQIPCRGAGFLPIKKSTFRWMKALWLQVVTLLWGESSAPAISPWGQVPSLLWGSGGQPGCRGVWAALCLLFILFSNDEVSSVSGVFGQKWNNALCWLRLPFLFNMSKKSWNGHVDHFLKFFCTWWFLWSMIPLGGVIQRLNSYWYWLIHDLRRSNLYTAHQRPYYISYKLLSILYKDILQDWSTVSISWSKILFSLK